MAKTRKGFDDALTLISMWGFVAIFLSAFTKLDLGPWTSGVILIIAGGGLMIEGQISSFLRWSRDGIQSNEVPLILTNLVGIFSIIFGFLSLPIIGLSTPTTRTITGFVALFAVIFIAVQRWAID